MKRAISLFLTLWAFIASTQAVLKEQTLEKSLAVLRNELKSNYEEQQKLMDWYEVMNSNQHKQILDVMQRSNQIGLMLYSQKTDYTFDVAYACNEATSLYNSFAESRRPFNNIVSTLQTEIERYANLIESLEKIPPMTSSAKDSMFASMSADSIAQVKEVMKQMNKDTAVVAKMKEFMLDEQGRSDRDECLTYAKALLSGYKEQLEKVQGDNEHYEFVQNHLKEANDYAEGRYEKLQKEIFIEGGNSYPKILSQLPRYIYKIKREIQEKYTNESDRRLQSEWSGRIVFFLILFTLVYMTVAGIVAALIVKAISAFARKRAAKSSNFIIAAFARTNRDKKVCTALAFAVILFAIALMVVISMINHNFLVMACKLLIEYAWLLGVILFSLLVRLPGQYIRGGFVLYTPMLLMGFLIIVMRIIFIPNDMLNLLFPVIIFVFTVFQWWSNKRFSKARDEKVTLYAGIKLDKWKNEVSTIGDEDRKEPMYIFDENSPYLEGKSDSVKEAILKRSYEAQANQEIEFRREEEKFTHSDSTYAWISLGVMIISLVVSFEGYTFLSLQIFIWWLFQLTFIHTITSLFDILSKGEERYLHDRMLDAAYKLEVKLKGQNARPKENIKIDLKDMSQRSRYISQTWPFDFLRICAVPVLAALSVIFSILWAADVFNLTEFCKSIFFTNFIDVEGVIQLSIFKITLAIALFFVFKFGNYLIKSLYLHFTLVKNVKNGESSATMFNNFASLFVWGVYFVLLLSLLQIPKSGISLVTAGLATGIGFAMKDLLENLFYGISLMSGRVKVGEWIECDGVRGKVEKIAYQSTTLSTLDGCKISFLNASLFTKNFKNLTTNHEYEFLPLTVGIAYNSDVDKARKVITEAIIGCKQKLEDGRDDIDLKKGVKVIVSELGDSSVNLYVSLWTDVAKKYWVKGRCLEAIYNALNSNGISIPFPQRDIHIIAEK